MSRCNLLLTKNKNFPKVNLELFFFNNHKKLIYLIIPENKNQYA